MEKKDTTTTMTKEEEELREKTVNNAVSNYKEAGKSLNTILITVLGSVFLFSFNFQESIFTDLSFSFFMASIFSLIIHKMRQMYFSKQIIAEYEEREKKIKNYEKREQHVLNKSIPVFLFLFYSLSILALSMVLLGVWYT